MMTSSVCMTTRPEKFLDQVRKENGLRIGEDPKAWSKRFLETSLEIPHRPNAQVRNEGLLDLLVEKFRDLDFGFELLEKTNWRGKKIRVVVFRNYPQINGEVPTLADMFLIPAEYFSAAERKPKRRKKAWRRKGWGLRERYAF